MISTRRQGGVDGWGLVIVWREGNYQSCPARRRKLGLLSSDVGHLWDTDHT